MPTARTRILFICLGNICRSPTAEGVFLHHANARGVADLFDVDSAGTGGWHTGERPDSRALAEAKRHGVHLPSRARKITESDLEAFDLLVCMDESNRRDVLDLGADERKVRLLLAYHPELGRRDVPDPYSGGPDEFRQVFKLIDAACHMMLDALLSHVALRTRA